MPAVMSCQESDLQMPCGNAASESSAQGKFLFNKGTNNIHQQILAIGKHHDLLLCNEVLGERLLDCLRSRYMYSC